MTISKSLFIQSSAQSYRLLILVVISLILMFADSRFGYLSQARYYAHTVTPIHYLSELPQALSQEVSDIFKKSRITGRESLASGRALNAAIPNTES